MPVYIHLANLVIERDTISEKYKGGLDQFRKDYKILEENNNQEDNEVFSIARMNADEFDIEKLIKNGIEYNASEHNSNDFTILSRYGGFLWKVDWLEINAMYAYHKNTSEVLKEKVSQKAKITINELTELFDKGEKAFDVIKD